MLNLSIIDYDLTSSVSVKWYISLLFLSIDIKLKIKIPLHTSLSNHVLMLGHAIWIEALNYSFLKVNQVFCEHGLGLLKNSLSNVSYFSNLLQCVLWCRCQLVSINYSDFQDSNVHWWILSSSGPDHVQVMSRSCSGHVQVMYKSSQYHLHLKSQGLDLELTL